MKKLIMSVVLVSSICTTEYVQGHLVANHILATSGNDITLQGAVVQTITLTGTFNGISGSFGTITGSGTVTLKDSTADHITLSNPTIGPSETSITLDNTAVAHDITFTGAFGKVLVKNGATIGGSVINGSIVNG